jgi:hypothetical protein
MGTRDTVPPDCSNGLEVGQTEWPATLVPMERRPTLRPNWSSWRRREPQLLAYMGKSPTSYTESITDSVLDLVSSRPTGAAQDTTVYGISSESYDFNFYRISQDSKR